jgi:hypothetical protein
VRPVVNEDLSPSEHAQLEKVQQLILALDKATRAHKLYLPNNQILQQHQEHLNQLFTSYLKEHDELALKVQPLAFFFLEQSVYHNDNKKENFAFRLYNEGMRAIRFKYGLSHGELLDFIHLLNNVTLESSGLDGATTMLWEKEFQHITYDIAQYIIDDGGENIEGKAEEILDPSMSSYTSPIPNGPPEDIEESISETILLPQSEFKKIAHDVCVLDSKEFEQIQREIANGEKHDRLMLDLFDIMVTLILEERDPQELKNLYQILLETIDATVLHGELNITSQLLWALRGMLEGGTGDFAMRHPDRILHIIDLLAT